MKELQKLQNLLTKYIASFPAHKDKEIIIYNITPTLKGLNVGYYISGINQRFVRQIKYEDIIQLNINN